MQPGDLHSKWPGGRLDVVGVDLGVDLVTGAETLAAEVDSVTGVETLAVEVDLGAGVEVLEAVDLGAGVEVLVGVDLGAGVVLEGVDLGALEAVLMMAPMAITRGDLATGEDILVGGPGAIMDEEGGEIEIVLMSQNE